MPKRRFCFTFFVLICFSLPFTVTAQTVNIPDDNLRAIIENALGKAPGDTITAAEMEIFTIANLPNANIRDLTGLEYAINLTNLNLGPVREGESVRQSNILSDISPIAGLTNLEELNLEFTFLSDISALQGLNNLTKLYLGGNVISDISPLAGLNKLMYLGLENTFLSDISPLQGLNNLQFLALHENSISDISPLTGLNNLTWLFLSGNSITDISPLLENTGLGRADIVDVTDNPLNAASINDHIPALQSRGVNVLFDAVVAEPVVIPDANLRAAIENVLGKTSGAAITTVDMGTLTELRAPNANITALTGLEAATNLRTLDLGSERVDGRWMNSNSISDISPLVHLTNLKYLYLDRNSVSDILPLAQLSNLEELILRGNSISDISPLANLTNLAWLVLTDNSISDISPLANLTSLEYLSLGTNSISDISPLAELNNLTRLSLEINSISDISPLENLTSLEYLSLWYNSISDISAVAGLNNLTYLSLEINSISNISPLANLTSLENLGLTGNSISNISPLAGLNNLTRLSLEINSISDISGLAGLNNLTQLVLHDNSISDISPLVANTGLGSGDTVDVRENPLNDASINDHIPTLQSRGVDVLFDAVVAEPVVFPDDNLRAAIADALGKTSGDAITTMDMEALTELDASYADVTDLTGLEAATNLTQLFLGFNALSDISPVAGLTNLTELSLDLNAISDISPLAGLTNLTFLDLSSNPISDISPLEGLTNLTDLVLSDTLIADISPVAGLTNLTDLDLWGSAVSVLSPLAANMGLGEGDWVDVTGNPLNQESINTHIPALRSRGVTVESDAVITEPVAITDDNLRAKIEEALGKASGDTITTADMANLTVLHDAENANITDLTGLEAAINLRGLEIWGNSISDISPLANLTNLTHLWLGRNSISNISPLANLTSLEFLSLGINSISDISPLANLTSLETLSLGVNAISDISPLANLTSLTDLGLYGNAISDISPLAGLNNLTDLNLGGHSISDISPLAGLNNLTSLWLQSNSISDISPLANLTNLTDLNLPGNVISDISLLEGLNNLRRLTLQNNSISDISPLIANAGLGSGDTVNLSENPLNFISINTHIPTLRSKGVEVRADNLKPTTSEFTLSIPAGVHAIHIPLVVNRINGVDGTIETVGDVYDALGDAVRYIITLGADGNWIAYLGDESEGSMADAPIQDDTGLIAVMKEPKTLELMGDALGTAGTSQINLLSGNNLVGVPLDPTTEPDMISDLLDEGVAAVAVSNAAGDGFHTIAAAGDTGDGPVMGGVGYIVVATGESSIFIEGTAWENAGAAMAAPAVAFSGTQTPVLHVHGGVMDEFGMLAQVPELSVTVKNLSTGASLDTVLGSEASYSATFVEFGRHAAKAGDVLEITAQSRNPFVGVRPAPQIVVSADEVLASRISLPDLELYEIPSETELLANFPNPFNPETWIPYRLAKAAKVSLEIYDTNGSLVRSIDAGFKPAAVYESRASAIYWDGRNNYGERVASGTYFYLLVTGTYSATRKMVIVK